MINDQLLKYGPLVAGALWSAGCMFSPNNGTEVEDSTQPLAFGGVLVSPGAAVTLQAARTKAGPFRNLDGDPIRSSTSPRRFYADNGSYTDVYFWQGRATIPATRWASTTDAEGCTEQKTFVRAKSAGFTLQTFDTSAPDSISCFVTNGIVEGLTACVSPEAPVVTVRRSNVFRGNVTLLTAADIDTYRCYEVIDGDLTINVPLSEVTSVDLPRLTRVTGNLQVTYTGEGVPDAAGETASRCGSPNWAITSHLMQLHLDALATVEGNVTLAQAGEWHIPPGPYAPYELGLDSLTELGGDLSIRTEMHRGLPCGLASLPYVPGDVTLDYVGHEVAELVVPLLPNVSEIGGTLEFKGAHDISNDVSRVLGGLQRVGSLNVLSIDGFIATSFLLPSLTDVTHTATFQGAGSDRSATALRRIGTLRLADGPDLVEWIGGATLELGGFELLNSPIISWLLTTPSKVTLLPSASVSLAGVPSLSNAAICDFASYHHGRGWLGTITRDGIAVSCP